MSVAMNLMKKFKKMINKLIVLILLNSFFYSPMALAGNLSKVEQANLSPQVALQGDVFNHNFNRLYFSGILDKDIPDTIANRRLFAQDLFKMKFKTLFPPKVQQQILEEIIRVLKGSHDSKKISQINIYYSRSNDPYINKIYEIFNQIGEKEFKNISINTNLKKEKISELIQLMLLDDRFKRIDFVERPALSKKTKAKKWLSQRLSGLQGDPQKIYLKKELWVLLKLYDMYKLQKVFGEKFLVQMDSKLTPTFAINVEFADGSSIDQEIKLGNKPQVSEPNLPRQQTKQTDFAAADNSENKKFTYNDVIAGFEKNQRQALHILESKRDDVEKLVVYITLLKHVREFDLANYEQGITPEQLESVRYILNKVSVALGRGPKFFNGRLQEKYLAKEKINPDGDVTTGLYQEDYEKVVEQIDAAIEDLNQRIMFHNRKIHKSTPFLKVDAFKNENFYMYLQTIKNEITIIQGFIRIDAIHAAAKRLDFLKHNFFAFNYFYDQLKNFPELFQQFSRLESRLFVAKKAKLLKQTRESVLLIEREKNNVLKDLKNVFNSLDLDLQNKDLKIDSSILDILIKRIESLNTKVDQYQNTGSYHQFLIKLFNELNQISASANESMDPSISPAIKSIIVKGLDRARKIIDTNLKRVLDRNNLIRQALPNTQFTNAEEVLKLLGTRFREITQNNFYEEYVVGLDKEVRRLKQQIEKAQDKSAESSIKMQQFYRLETVISPLMKGLEFIRKQQMELISAAI